MQTSPLFPRFVSSVLIGCLRNASDIGTALIGAACTGVRVVVIVGLSFLIAQSPKHALTLVAG
jgi:hypothetical protein